MRERLTIFSTAIFSIAVIAANYVLKMALGWLVIAFTVMKLWQWFIASQFHIHQIGLFEALGINFFFSVLAYQFDPYLLDRDALMGYDTDEAELMRSRGQHFVAPIVYAIIMLAGGCIAHLLM